METENTTKTAETAETAATNTETNIALEKNAQDTVDSFDSDDGSDWFTPEAETEQDAQTADRPIVKLEDAQDAEQADTEENVQEESAQEEPEKNQSAAEEKAKEDAMTTLRYYGREVQVKAEELPVLAQKGMDYDKVRTERDALLSGETGQAVELLGEYAKQMNMPLPQYIEMAKQQLLTQRQQGAVEQAVQGGMSEQAAAQLVAEQEKARQATALLTQQQIEGELEEFLGKLYEKYVPAPTREYIESMDALTDSPTKAAA